MEVIDRYKITEANLIMVASPRGDKKIVFRHEDLDGVNPYDPNETTVPKTRTESLWESGLYGEWRNYKRCPRTKGFQRRGHNESQSCRKLAWKELPISLAVTGKAVLRTSMRRKATPSSGDCWKTATLWFRTLTSVFREYPEGCQTPDHRGPKATFLDKEVSLIRNFLNQNDGNLLVALDPTESLSVVDRPAFGLRPLLKEWGLRCHDMLVYDPTKENFDFFSGDYSLRTYSSKKTHPIVSMLAEQGYSVQADRCRPVEVDPDHPVD